MARSSLFAQLRRTLRIADFADRRGLDSREAVEMARSPAMRRRDLLKLGAAAGATAALGAAGCAADAAAPGDAPGTRLGAGRAALPKASGSVGVVGAGLAGLACAYELQRSNITATIYEAGSRAGGRCFSMGGSFAGPVTFPGQVVERGGEFIDTTHMTMKAYAKEFGLTLADISKDPGEVFYRVGGEMVPESVVVDEYRVLVDAMRDDLRRIGAPTARSFTPDDEYFDRLNLRQYLESRGAGRVIRTVLDVAYTIEYGLDADRLSSLSFLLFIHADRRSKFTPFGVFSDERYHVVGGNQQIADGLAARLPGQVQYESALVAARKLADGRVELTLREGSRTRTAVHDAVVIALPFSVLRGVDLDPSLGFSPEKQRAIHELQYGTNCKMMVGFGARPWIALGSNGSSYADLANVQATWETDARNATASRGIITDYSGGARGAGLDPRRVQTHAADFVADLDRVFPGAAAAVTRDRRGTILAHLEAWPKNPLSLGSYTANHPGYFTTIADEESRPEGNVFFAGEHANSFYEWQGFMEGAALSGLRAAGEVAALLRR